MLRYEVPVRSPADEVLYEGLPELAPASAIAWVASQFTGPRSTAARRIAEYTGTDDGAQWAVDVAQRFAAAL